MEEPMKSRIFSRVVAVGVVSLACVVLGVHAKSSIPRHFSGVINDYTTINTVPTNPTTHLPVGTGWEMRGPWKLDIDDECADFSAAITMEMADPPDLKNPAARMQHTHHLTVKDGTVSFLANGGIEVTGPVTITKDGDAAPAALQGSTLVIDITGGALVTYSNLAITFQGGGTAHFGSQAIHGVVRHAGREN
jgi:hypothetical protein